MERIKFDIVALFVGGLFFTVYLMVFEDTFFKLPMILVTIYLFISTLCFTFVLRNFETELKKRLPAVFLRLIYLGVYLLSPFYLAYLLIRGKHENRN